MFDTYHNCRENAFNDMWYGPFDKPAGPLPQTPQFVLDVSTPVVPQDPGLILTALPPVPSTINTTVPLPVPSTPATHPAGAGATVAPATAPHSFLPIALGIGLAIALMR